MRATTTLCLKAQVVAFLCGVLRLSQALIFGELQSEHSIYGCPYTNSPDPEQHETFLQRLNGKRILFIGDSVTRLQYITLASFLTTGLCPEDGTHEKEREYQLLYSLNETDYIYRESSKLLNTPCSVETCFCLEGELEPDSRSFTYEDEQGIRIQLEYMAYTNEKMRPMRCYLQTALNMRPTHVVMNFGLSLITTDHDCGKKEEDKHRLCPYIPQVCEFLTDKQPFHVIWQTTTPKLKDSRTSLSIGEGHHLHIPQQCNLTAAAVLNRVEILSEMEPDHLKRMELYDDQMQLRPEAYHAFNGRLMDMITSWNAGHGQPAL